MNTATRLVVGLVSLGTLSLTVLGCTATSLDRIAIPAEEIVLGDAVAAVYLSPQARDFVEGKRSGYLVLIDGDGRRRVLGTSGMDQNRLEWTELGIHFSDRDNEYLLGEEGLITASSPKEVGIQVTSFMLDQTYVAVFNEGFTDNGYRSTVVEFTRGIAEQTVVEGYLGVVALCGEDLYAVHEASGAFLDEYPVDAEGMLEGMPQRLLVHLWPEEQRVIEAYRASAQDDALDWAPDAPCAHGVAYAITAQHHGDLGAEGIRPLQALLRSWDTRTGERIDRVLVDAEGYPLDLTVDQVLSSRYRGIVLRGGELWWMGGDGIVRATELTTGVSRDLFTTSSASTHAGDTQALFAGDHLFVLTVPLDRDQDLALSRYSLETGELEDVVVIEDVNRQTGLSLVVRDFAISPALRDGDGRVGPSP